MQMNMSNDFTTWGLLATPAGGDCGSRFILILFCFCFVWSEGPVFFNGSSTSLVTSPPPTPCHPLSQGWPRPLIPLNLASSYHVTLASSTLVLHIKQNKPTPCTSKVLQPEGAPLGISSRLVQYSLFCFFNCAKPVWNMQRCTKGGL